MEERLYKERNESKLSLRFNLKQMCVKDKLTQIMLITTVNKQRIRVYTKLRIEPLYWDKGCYRCRMDLPMNLREKKRLIQINQKLNKLESSVYQLDNQLANKGLYVSLNDLQKLVKEKQTAIEDKLHPIDYLQLQVKEYLKGLNRRGKRGIASTQRTYITALKRLENFCKTTKYSLRTFDDFNNKFFTDFTNYLYSVPYQKGAEQKQYTQNTVINTLKVIKNLLHRAYDNEVTDNNYYQKVQTILASDTSDKVYLNEKEIRKLANLKLTSKHERHIRDMFIIACYTALRISDIQKLNDAVIQNGVISLYQTKTKEQVEIPILKEIVSLIIYYQEHGFPYIDICKANETIKELVKRCGICQSVSFQEHRGGNVQIKTLPKWELITFHTARRSCITNLYKRGYPVNYIMTLSGHRSVQAFQRYMRASSKELMSNFVSLLKKDHAI